MGRLNFRPSKIQVAFLKGLQTFLWLMTVIVQFLTDVSQYPGLGFLRLVASPISRMMSMIGHYEETLRVRLLRLQNTKQAAQRLSGTIRRR